MPVKRFWFYNKQVDRLAAEEDLRMINLLASVTSGEAYGKAIDNLRKQMGEIHVIVPVARTFNADEIDPEFERDKLRALKMKIRAAKKGKSVVTDKE